MKLTTKNLIKQYSNTPGIKIFPNPYFTNPIIIGYVEEGLRKSKRPVIQAICKCGKVSTSTLNNFKNLKSCGCRLPRKLNANFTYTSYVSVSSESTRKFNDYLKRSKHRGIEFKLTFQEFEQLISQPCTYCQFPNAGIDRVDNSKGYELANTKPCCKFCNRAKHEESEETFINWLQHVKNTFATTV